MNGLLFMKNNIKNNLLKITFLLPIIYLLVSCKSTQPNGLKNGDFVFVTAKNTGLSEAINNVTQKNKKETFDHIGILKKEKETFYVLHAATDGGSQKQELGSFIINQKSDNQNIIVYRLKNEYQKTIPKAIEKAENMLGKPYNFNYILDENAYYCSDFIERAFRDNHIFALEPMTFKDPKTGEIDTFWKEFYTKKNLEVPEGKLGCNPNGLARSNKIKRIKKL